MCRLGETACIKEAVRGKADLEDKLDKQVLYKEAANSIINASEDKAFEIIDIAKAEGFDLLELLLVGFQEGDDVIGDEFDRGVISLPELIYAAEVMKGATNRILDILHKEGVDVDLKKGKILLATVEGDVHDIGKSIVASTLQKAGFEVIDLGCEVPCEVILEEAKKHEVDVIGTSALLTTTLTEQKKLEKLLSDTDEKKNFITMVGGAPCSQRWAKKIGADGYSGDAIEAVEVAERLISEKKEK